EEDAFGRNARLDQVGDASGKRLRLTGAGSGDDEQRAVAMGRSRQLLRVQRLRDGECHAHSIEHLSERCEAPGLTAAAQVGTLCILAYGSGLSVGSGRMRW